MKKINRLVILLVLLSVFIVDCNAYSKEISAFDPIKGKLSISNYNYSDSMSPYKFNITTIRLRLQAKSKDDSFKFHFKGRERFKTSSKEMSSKNKQHNISTLNFEYTSSSKKNHITFGRLDALIAEVDGINLKRDFTTKSSAGIFLGLMPDPYLQTLNSDYSTVGAYHTYNSTSFNSSFAVVNDSYKGSADRSYLYMQSSYIPIKKIRLSNTVIVDTLGISSLNISSNIRLNKKARLNVFYSQYKAIKLLKSMDYNIDSGIQRSMYIKFKYKLLKTLRIYSKFQFRTRDMDGKTGKKINIGSNLRLPYLPNVNVGARYTRDYKFTSDVDSILAELSSYFFRSLSLSLNIQNQKIRSKLRNTTKNVMLYRASSNYRFSKFLYFNLSYEYVTSSEFVTHTLLSMAAVKF